MDALRTSNALPIFNHSLFNKDIGGNPNRERIETVAQFDAIISQPHSGVWQDCFMAYMFVLIGLLVSTPAAAQASDAMLLLKTWQPGQHVNGWLMSEKLDGVRARWDGHHLISRGGHRFAAPQWFTKGFPPFELDGELWSRRGDFERIVSIVRRQQPHAGWKQITYQIFEVPHQPGGLLQRLNVLQDYLSSYPNPHIHIIEQRFCHGQQHLQTWLQQLVSQGAEGIVVRNPDAPYQTGRSAESLKVKPYMDTECTVSGYKPGKGKLAGKTGAIFCRMKDGRIITIGSGLNREQRNAPPALGRIITFKYYGLTSKGKPRHPVFLRLWQGDYR